mmetsp:Transcript_28453/g.65557  ORF Transcript_28453/g.65557 Transcript_28453/m.65557 type:complete len:268 (-) Transcript_28453:313-1116(-)
MPPMLQQACVLLHRLTRTRRDERQRRSDHPRRQLLLPPHPRSSRTRRGLNRPCRSLPSDNNSCNSGHSSPRPPRTLPQDRQMPFPCQLRRPNRRPTRVPCYRTRCTIAGCSKKNYSEHKKRRPSVKAKALTLSSGRTLDHGRSLRRRRGRRRRGRSVCSRGCGAGPHRRRAPCRPGRRPSTRLSLRRRPRRTTAGLCRRLSGRTPRRPLMRTKTRSQSSSFGTKRNSRNSSKTLHQRNQERSLTLHQRNNERSGSRTHSQGRRPTAN